MKPITYQAAYLWQCPDCGITWQARRRPRAGRELVCAAFSEQRQMTQRGNRGIAVPCGAVHTSAGRREGIAPNLNI